MLFLGTASYRLMPEIILKEPIYDEDAEQLQKCFTQGVIDLEDDNNGKEIFLLLFILKSKLLLPRVMTLISLVKSMH